MAAFGQKIDGGIHKHISEVCLSPSFLVLPDLAFSSSILTSRTNITYRGYSERNRYSALRTF